MQGIHNGFRIDFRPHFSMLSLGVGGSKNNQKGKSLSFTKEVSELFSS
jgi:hypothetical protein